jgi:uncharacterized membrane protein YccC
MVFWALYAIGFVVRIIVLRRLSESPLRVAVNRLTGTILALLLGLACAFWNPRNPSPGYDVALRVFGILIAAWCTWSLFGDAKELVRVTKGSAS